MNACMLCEKESSELTKMEIRNDNGEVVPATIKGTRYDSICICPDCMLALFASGAFTPSEHTPEMDRRS